MKNYGWFYLILIIFVLGTISLAQNHKIVEQDKQIKLLTATQCTKESNDTYYKGCIELATETATKRLIKQLGDMPADRDGKVYKKNLINALTLVNNVSNKWEK